MQGVFITDVPDFHILFSPHSCHVLPVDNAGVRIFKELYCLMHTLTCHHGQGKPLGTNKLCRHWPNTGQTLPEWPVQTVPSAVTNQCTHDMRDGSWHVSEMKWDLLKVKKWGLKVKLLLCRSTTQNRLLGRLDGVTAPQVLNVDSRRKRCQLHPLAALHVKQNVLVSQQVVQTVEVVKTK